MKILKRFIRKWIKGECRHLCCLCPFWYRYCQHDFGCSTKYGRGYADGYDDGYTAAMKNSNKNAPY